MSESTEISVPRFNPKTGSKYAIGLPEQRNWRAERHVFRQHTVDAVQAALACRRPLLVRGEPGTGKSQLARAVASELKWPFIYRVLNGRTECEDLLYQFDAVARLAQAQVAGAAGREGGRTDLDPLNYVIPGVLWWAYNWDTAREQAERARKFCGEACEIHSPPLRWKQGVKKGVVVLIDEIDKAESEVPNSLLEGLGTSGFQVPHGGGFVSLPPGFTPPLVIVTTNEERELPPAFLRRCLVLNLWLPDEDPLHRDQDEAALKKLVESEILEYSKAHFEGAISEEVFAMAFEQWWADRRAAGREDPRPGLAEFLDILRALHEMHPGDAAAQEALLKRIHPYILGKHQQRGLAR